MHTREFEIVRERITDDHKPIDRWLVGDDWRWAWGIAGCFQALAAPRSGARVPAAPEPRDLHAQSLGYWGALHYLLLHRLGWAEPHRGLERWYAGGQGTDDPTLRFIRAVWDEDDGLDVYFAWLLRRQPHFDLRNRMVRNAAPTTPMTRHWHHKGVRLGAVPAVRRFEHFDSASFDPLHLTGHFIDPSSTPGGSRLLRYDEHKHHAILMTETMNWYESLVMYEDEMPMSGVHSWKVDVHVAHVGRVGTFRRSAITGLWFTGKHSTHALGHPQCSSGRSTVGVSHVRVVPDIVKAVATRGQTRSTEASTG
ncbi:hypothetical protein [Planctomonas deserti]|uniref:hypothetical protein n=1 Tax=Planctomonas deserti TaxID=2144185 RepID=UPI00131F394C|nr:hypothetical protein [Planctomonas deserti]